METELTKDILATVDKHICSLEGARDKAQENLSSVLKFASSIQSDYNERLQSYKEELHSAKSKIESYEARMTDYCKRCDRLQEKYDKLHEAHEKLIEKYELLAERSLEKSSSGASRSEIKING